MKFKKIILIVAAFLVVLVVIARILVPNDSVIEFRKAAVKADLQTFHELLDLYKNENGFYPTTDQGLDALFKKPESSPIPQQWRKHIREAPLDPWGRRYVYRLLTPTGSNPYLLFSLGPDGVESKDDIYR